MWAMTMGLVDVLLEDLKALDSSSRDQDHQRSYYEALH